MDDKLKAAASQFMVDGNIESVEQTGQGITGESYLIRTSGTTPDYILQHKNKSVLRNVPAMMENTVKVTAHLKRKVAEAGGDPLREVVTLVPQIDGPYYYADPDGEYWTMFLNIDGLAHYGENPSPEIAERAGYAIGKFHVQLGDMKLPLADTAPELHNMRLRLEQWDNAQTKNRTGRAMMIGAESEWIRSRRDAMEDFWVKIESGELPPRVTHNDAKIANVLFDQKADPVCIAGLDMVKTGTVLNDYGEGIRNFANRGGKLDVAVFEAFTRGWLSQTKDFLLPLERQYMTLAPAFVTYERIMALLTDYLNGASESVLVEARAQYKLLLSLEENHGSMTRFAATLG